MVYTNTYREYGLNASLDVVKYGLKLTCPFNLLLVIICYDRLKYYNVSKDTVQFSARPHIANTKNKLYDFMKRGVVPGTIKVKYPPFYIITI